MLNNFFELSVHELVDFVLRSGDIDNRYFNNASMVEGSLIHKYYQGKQNDSYESEVYLDGVINLNNYSIKLSGRCDGLIKNNDEVTIDEIKSYVGEKKYFIENNILWHLGQAECYAYLYCLKEKIKTINIQLTYISQIDKKTDYKKFNYTVEELKEKVESYIFQYLDFLNILEDCAEKRDESLKSLKFPFDKLRNGQKDMIDFIENNLTKKQIGYIEAPTGIGKTVSSIYASLSTFNKIKCDKFFYLTPKNSGFKLATDTLKIFNNVGIAIKAVTLLAKEKMCLSDKKKCNPESCFFARGYYSKIKVALKESLIKYSLFDEKIIKEIAYKYNICPFELSLDLSLYCDYIVCDYNYVFHPIARLRRFFEMPDKTYNLNLLIDEAHNLIDRSRSMYSTMISFSQFKEAKKELKTIENKDIKKALSKLTTFFNLFNKIEFIDNQENNVDYLKLEKLDDQFIDCLNDMSDLYKIYSSNHPNLTFEKADEFFLEVYKFCKMYDLIDENFKIYLHKLKDDYEIHIFCLDASEFINSTLYKVNSSTLFSATLSPLSYYEKLITNDHFDNELIIDNPFDKNNLNLIINNKLSLIYQNREKSLNDVILNIKTFVLSKIGNYLVFLPSYEYLYKIKKELKFEEDVNVIYQSKKMTNEEKNIFLDKFEAHPKKTTVGFAVIGGTFAEGIDLVSDRLIGVSIVGIGLPSFDYENSLLKDYYESKGLNGYNFTYLNPAMNRVMQAVGRLIRSENDRGSVLLIDSRYLYKNYLSLFRKDRDNYKVIKNVDDLKKVLQDFYNN